MAKVHSATQFRTLADRISNSSAVPRHALCAIVMHPEITLQIHTAGGNALWEIPVKEAAMNDRLIRGMCPEDALRVGIWYGDQEQRDTLRAIEEFREAKSTAGKSSFLGGD